MLSTILDKLESLFSKAFAVASIPLLAFISLHAAMAYRVSPTARRWMDLYFTLDTARLAVVTFAVLMAVVIVAYVLSTLNDLLREILEGKHLMFSWVEDLMSARYRSMLRRLERQFITARRERRLIESSLQKREDDLRGAYQKASRTNKTCNYNSPVEIRRLRILRDSNQTVSDQDIQEAVDALLAALGTNSPSVAGNDASVVLDRDIQESFQMMRYASDKWQSRLVYYLERIQFHFAGKNVAPTRMGNVANLAPYYAASRYYLNLPLLWTDIQKLAKADDKFYPLLQQAKLQLDFLVSLVWQTVAFTSVWLVALPLTTKDIQAYVAVAVLGPLLTLTWYHVAVANYRALSDLMRATVDLYRLELLKALRIPLPSNSEQEKELWVQLEQKLAYGEDVSMPLAASS